MNNIIIPSMQDVIQICGETRHLVDGNVVYKNHNAINNNLKSYLQESLDSVVDNAIDSLFGSSEITQGGGQDGNDGVAVFDTDAGSWLTMTTTTMTPNNAHGKRWQGQIASLSQSRTVNESALGHDYGNGATHFSTVFATQSFTGIPLNAGANYAIEWEIYIQ